MNRSLRDSLFSAAGGAVTSPRNGAAVTSPRNGFSHRRGNSLNGGEGPLSSKLSDDNHQLLDLFSRSRRSLSIASSDDSSEGTTYLPTYYYYIPINFPPFKSPLTAYYITLSVSLSPSSDPNVFYFKFFFFKKKKKNRAKHNCYCTKPPIGDLIVIHRTTLLLHFAVSVKLGRLSIGSTKPAKNGLDDLLSSSDGGKHDYDW